MKTNLIICIFALGTTALYKSKVSEFSQQSVLVDTVKTDPVCKMKVKHPANYTSSYKKVEYWFCAKGCKLKFDKNPAAFF